jgi:mannose-6-phosphate isomerase
MGTMEPTLLTFAPILKPKVWGGRRLTHWGKRLPHAIPIGESWELADLPLAVEEGRSVIDSGIAAGTTLRRLIEQDQTAVLGRCQPSGDGGFPLLVKLLDARENLSVQVHPDAAYAAAHPESHLKTESWVVLEADPGAVIYKGVKEGVTPQQFADAIGDETIVDLLIQVPVHAGDCHDLPSGTCHALGAGVLVAEVQTPSDTTFRVFDWGRTDRTLHIDAALQCIDFAPPTPTTEPAVLEHEGLRTSLLSHTAFYAIERIDAISEYTLPLDPGGAPEVLMMIAGEATLGEYSLPCGQTALLPANFAPQAMEMKPGTSVLRITLGSTD